MVFIPTAKRVRHVLCRTEESAKKTRSDLRKEGFDVTSYREQKDGKFKVYGSWSKKKQKAVSKINKAELKNIEKARKQKRR